MFLPYKDDAPRLRAEMPWVQKSLIGACVLVFMFTHGVVDSPTLNKIFLHFGFIPTQGFGGALPGIFSYMFLHAGFFHLGGNMLFLWIFGDNVEDIMGHGRFFVFYMICGVLSAFVQGLFNPDSIPLVGASGAIAGVLGAYILCHPHAKVHSFAWFIVLFYRITFPAWAVIGMWVILQVLNLQGASGGGVAYLAHVAGFLCGLSLTPLFVDLKDIRNIQQDSVSLDNQWQAWEEKWDKKREMRIKKPNSPVPEVKLKGASPPKSFL